MNAVKFIGVFLLALAVTGCATNSLPTISESQTRKIIEAFDSPTPPTPSGAELVHHEAWLQAENKDEECKLLFRASTARGDIPFWEQGPISLYWDGDCKEGYAYGLGREFFEGVSTGLMSDVVFYGEPGSEPTYYYKAKYDSHTYSYHHKVLGFDGAEGDVYWQIINVNNVGRPDFNVTETKVFESSESAWDYIQINWPYEDRLELRKFTVTENGPRAFTRAYSRSPAHSFRDAFGFYTIEAKPLLRFVEYKSGVRTLETLEDGVNKRVLATETLSNFVDQSIKSMEIPLNNIDQHLASAKRAVEMYKRRICHGEVSVDWMEDSIYGRICLPGGDLSRYKDEIEAYKVTQEKLKEQGRQEQAELQKQQQAQQIAAARQTQANYKMVADSLSSLNASMAQFNEQAGDILEDSMHHSSPSVSFNSPASSTTNCVAVSNIINCKTH